MFKKTKVIILIAVIMALTLVLTVPASAEVVSLDIEQLTIIDCSVFKAMNTDRDTWEEMFASDYQLCLTEDYEGTSTIAKNTNLWLDFHPLYAPDYIYVELTIDVSTINTSDVTSNLAFNVSIPSGYQTTFSCPPYAYQLKKGGGKIDADTTFSSKHNYHLCEFDFGTLDASTKSVVVGFWYTNAGYYSSFFDIRDIKVNTTINELEEERDEAESGGNSNIDALGSAVPNKSADLLASFSKLTKSMVHDEAVCNIKFPQIKVPALGQGDGTFFGETVLYDGGNVDMAYYVDLIPKDVLTVIRSVLTVALILYCFKELYGFIEYALTLNKTKGGTD